MNNIGIHIFRRDLRLYDNLGLINLIKLVDVVIPIFILDENQIIKNDKNQHYFSNNVVQFMCESLIDLNDDLLQYNSCLRVFFGIPHDIIKQLIEWLNLNYKNSNIIVSYNNDYSKYSIKRDNEINKYCIDNNIKLLINDNDLTLISFEKMLKNNKTVYKQYGAFYKNALLYKVNKPMTNNYKYYFSNKVVIKIKNIINNLNYLQNFYKINKNLAQNGGRLNGIRNMNNIKNHKYYNELRDRLDYKTTNLSAYLNFGCISIREVYYKILKILGKRNGLTLIKQLYWRDYYLQILIFEHDGNEYKHIDNRYNKFKWKNDSKYWNLLMNSQTGFLLIDSAIKELKITGFMHNRSRLLVCTFWTKYLLIDIFHPIYGSQVGFSKYLVDAIGISQNKLNHQWITELDLSGRRYAPKNIPLAGRPIDISNKMIKKYDPDCIYIKTWLPHLKEVPNKQLINYCMNYNNEVLQYKIPHPAPIFDPKLKYLEWIELCKNKY